MEIWYFEYVVACCCDFTNFDSAFIDVSDGLAGLLIVRSATELIVYDVIVEFYHLVPAGVDGIGIYPAVMVGRRTENGSFSMSRSSSVRTTAGRLR